MDKNIYSEDSLWDSFEAGYCDPLDYEWDPLDYECPKCHLWGEFIHDEEELIHHGFSKSDAPLSLILIPIPLNVCIYYTLVSKYCQSFLYGLRSLKMSPANA